MRRARRIPLTHVWHEVDGLQTHSAVAGEGPVLVLVPGLSCSGPMYGPVIRALARHFRVHAYDPPGHGRSESRAEDHLTIDRLTDHLQAWLREVGLSDVVLVGHSLGGEVAVALAARRDPAVRSLVLLAPTGLPDRPNMWHQLMFLVVDGLMEPPNLVLRALKSYWTVGWRRFFGIASDQRRHRTAPLLSRVRVPVLLMEGHRDPTIPDGAIMEFARRLPKARVEFVPGAHAFHFVAPNLVADRIRAFVETGGVDSREPESDAVRVLQPD